MARQLSMDRKNVYRREESQRVRIERIVAGYVKHRYSKIYEEAYEFYQHLDKLYPNKKDLRRSNEYEWLKNGTAQTMKKFYKRKAKDNMVLDIPLLNESEIGTINTTQVDEIPPIQQEIIVHTTQTDEIPPCQQEITAHNTQESSTQETTISMPSVSSTDLLPVNDETLEEIISGLREDPNLNNIFDNLDFELDDCPLW